jgi:hypothetical protein
MSCVLFDYIPFDNTIKKLDKDTKSNTIKERKTPQAKWLLALKLAADLAQALTVTGAHHSCLATKYERHLLVDGNN